jgi:uncharacterized protein (TIGR03437 family)
MIYSDSPSAGRSEDATFSGRGGQRTRESIKVIRRSINSDKVLAFLFLLAAAPVRGQAPPPYTITTIAGQLGGTPTYSGDGGVATSAFLWGPSGLIFDSSGNLDIGDTDNQVVRQINASGTISTIAGSCTATPCVGAFSGDAGAATKAGLDNPSGLAFDSKGNLYIADTDNFEIREVTNGTINTVAGHNSSGASFSGDLAAATSAQLWNPSSVAVDPSGNFYIADAFNNVVRVVCETQTPIACTNIEFGSDTWAAGDINTFSGDNAMGAGYQGDGGPATGALLNNPSFVLLDAAGNLYISDAGNNVIRKVNTSGIISTIVGDGTGLAGYQGDGGPANQAQLNNPKGLAFDSSGNLYIADTDNCVIRMVALNNNIYTIAGNQSAGCGASGNLGPATSAQLNLPAGVAVTGGKIYIADTGNNAIRLLTPAPELPQINAGGVITAGSFGASTTVAPGSWIEIYGAYLASDARSWGTADFNGSNAPISLDGTSVTVGGQSAFVAYISPGQVNVQTPSNITAGTQPLILKTQFGATAAYSLAIGTAPGIYAPSILNIGGNQYAGALLANSSTWVLPAGAVLGLTSQPAAPGDIITMYGVGFGTVTPAVAAGQLVPTTEQTALTAPVQILFGTTPATLPYQGLAPGFVGLYQFNVQVPTVAAGNAVPLTITQGGVTLPQTLYTAVGN